jgi:hypothetical protein
VGKLSGLNESLAAIMTRPQVVDTFDPRFMPPEPEDTAMLEVLSALVEAVRAMPQAQLDVAQLVKAIKSVKFPESKPIDLTPIVEAIGKIELEVELPEHKPMAPCAYTFTIQRNDLGVATHIIAVPGVVEALDKPDTASYE